MRKYDFVLTALSFYPITGGIENSIYNLSKELKNLGYNTLILTTDNRLLEKTKPFIFEIINIKGQDVIRYHYYKNPTLKLVSAFIIILLIKLKYFSRYFICRDNLHAFATSFLKFDSLYLIPGLDVHELYDHNLLNNKFKKFLQVYAIKKSFKLVVLSQFMRNEVVKYYKRPPLVINPGFNKPLQNIEEVKIPDINFSLISVGRFVKHKNFSMLLECLSFLPEKFNLNLIGYGDLKEQLSDLIDFLKLNKRVNFISNGENADKYFSKSSIYILPSIYEPFGQVLLEAMSYGLKICAFDSAIREVKTATKEIVPEFALFLSKKLTSESLAETIIEASKKQIAKSDISNYVQKKYSWIKFTNEILNQFD